MLEIRLCHPFLFSPTGTISLLMPPLGPRRAISVEWPFLFDIFSTHITDPSTLVSLKNFWIRGSVLSLSKHVCSHIRRAFEQVRVKLLSLQASVSRYRLGFFWSVVMEKVFLSILKDAFNGCGMVARVVGHGGERVVDWRVVVVVG